MKKRKDPTVPLTCRVSPELRRNFEDAAASMGMSLSEYAAMMVNVAEYGETGVEELRRRHALSVERIEWLEKSLRHEKETVWRQEPFAAMLSHVLENEQCLERLYAEHGEAPFAVERLTEAGFRVNALLQGRRVGGLHFYFTGRHGWAFADATQRQVLIKRRG